MKIVKKGTKKPKKRGPSAIEEEYARQVKLMGFPDPVREYRFCPTRRWRTDFAWPEHRLAVEIEGGVFIGGRHTRGIGFLKDIEKYNHLALLEPRWRLLRFAGSHVRSGIAAEQTWTALESDKC